MPDSVWATQSINVTSATGLSFWRQIQGWLGTGDYPATSLFTVTLGSTLIYYNTLTGTTEGEIESTFTEWENVIVDVSSYSGVQDLTFTAYATDALNGFSLQVNVDDVELLPSSIVSATIEDSSKTWTADQFNTDGMFILTSGDVKGYSCTILDTFENYIQVPTTYANIINNIRVYETGYGNYEDFETGATTWTKDDELNIDFESTGPGGETPSPHSGTYCCKISQGPE